MGNSVSCFTMIQGCYNCKQDQNSNVLVNGYTTMPLQFSRRSSTSKFKWNLEIYWVLKIKENWRPQQWHRCVIWTKCLVLKRQVPSPQQQLCSLLNRLTCTVKSRIVLWSPASGIFLLLTVLRRLARTFSKLLVLGLCWKHVFTIIIITKGATIHFSFGKCTQFADDDNDNKNH